MIFDSNSIDRLRLLVKDFLSPYRFKHTEGVEEMSAYIGRILLPERVDELRVAALLHDITKELSYEDHLELLNSSSINYTQEDLQTKPALHSISAVPFIERNFKDYATSDVLSAVANHTLGVDNISLFDEIIFISDYVEIGRTYPTCIEVRKYLIDNLNTNKSFTENLTVLHRASILAIDYTIQSISQRGEIVNSKTFSMRKHLCDLIAK